MTEVQSARDQHAPASNAQHLHAQGIQTYRRIRELLLEWNWGDAADQFHDFCESFRAYIPAWYEDEFIFAGMKLWADDRPVQVLRHFALFFDRALGAELFWSEEELFWSEGGARFA